jgi:hypothetical protein
MEEGKRWKPEKSEVGKSETGKLCVLLLTFLCVCRETEQLCGDGAQHHLSEFRGI